PPAAGHAGTAEPRRARRALRAGRRARATSGFLRRVLRGALRHERVLLRDEDAVRVAAADPHVPPELELVRDAPAVDHRHRLRPLDVADPEAKALPGVSRAVHRPAALPDHRDGPGVRSDLARLDLGRAAGDRD